MFLMGVASYIQGYKANSSEERFIAIRELINNSNDTTIFLLNLLSSLKKPTTTNIIEHIEGNRDFYLFNQADKKMAAVIIIYRFYKEINLELNLASEEYLHTLTVDCVTFFIMKNKTNQNNRPLSKSREIETKKERSPRYLIIGLIILGISIYLAQDAHKLNDIAGSLVGLGVLVGVFTTLGGFIHYKLD